MNVIDGGGGGGAGVSGANGNGLGAGILNDPALPTQFVLSMKTLFDILDDQQTGFVKFSDIEKGWQDERCIELLRKVTPASGLLSFERFCGGLKLCLLKNQKETTFMGGNGNSSSGGGVGVGSGGGSGNSGNVSIAGLPMKPICTTNNQHISSNINHNSNCSQNVKTTTATTVRDAKALNYYGSVKACKTPIKLAARPPSAPMLEIENPLASSIWGVSSSGGAGSNGSSGGGGGGVSGINCGPTIMHTSNMVASQSMPQLSPDSEESEVDMGGVVRGVGVVGVYHSPPPPPKPPRARVAAKLQASNAVNSATLKPGQSKAEIRSALQNWQMNILLNEMDTKEKHKLTTSATMPPYLPAQFPYRRGCADGGSSSATESAGSINGHATIPPPAAKKSNAKRRDSRRHTLQNGIDYNVMMRRLKQLEEEREMLLLALNAVERARDCYLQQVSHVQEKIKYLGLMGHVEQWSEEAQQERLNFQRARILEVNRCLAALAETCYPMHLNLAFSGESSKTATSASFINVPSSQSTKICDADVVY